VDVRRACHQRLGRPRRRCRREGRRRVGISGCSPRDRRVARGRRAGGRLELHEDWRGVWAVRPKRGRPSATERIRLDAAGSCPYAGEIRG
jgi:hypothetical protein